MLSVETSLTDYMNLGTHVVTCSFKTSFFKPKDSFMYPILDAMVNAVCTQKKETALIRANRRWRNQSLAMAQECHINCIGFTSSVMDFMDGTKPKGCGSGSITISNFFCVSLIRSPAWHCCLFWGDFYKTWRNNYIAKIFGRTGLWGVPRIKKVRFQLVGLVF